ncbi:type III-B CRISPR module RAMP protein Cmr4 [Methylacidiphilum caldifontis]|uniref:Type III-B CRISPR module RAMP protein Cmr4 n=1 Tax=Methylacidiphilum caldifontis TaxID=2795386 RepID=A0A4Y8PAD3_9BACT|nr:type III-B CRISPR module RAMP protein Cmr4 [Methylacidiphilum caldifontis]TFE67821.1 type III-B CRISPR module RAMP protein Cmr4 [Methylacidiphilum caldifontis]
MSAKSYRDYFVIGMGLDPIHVGTGGSRLGQIDLTIVRDPVTRVPKIPGSSFAGVYRTYAAMFLEEERSKPNSPIRRESPYFPNCTGQGKQPSQNQGGHCGKPDCPICVTFGFAKGQGGGFAGLAAFSDAHVLLFPVATREGPIWITSPTALRLVNCEIDNIQLDNFLYQEPKENQESDQQRDLNLGWLMFERKNYNNWEEHIKKNINDKIPEYIKNRIGLLSDKLFSFIVNCNLEVRTSVSIDPDTGTAGNRALFSYEALPRTTILVWTVTCRNPKHFKVGDQEITAQINENKIDSPDRVFEVIEKAHEYLEHLGIGGMNTRGMGRLRVISSSQINTSSSNSKTSDTV